MTRDEARAFLLQNLERVCPHLFPAGKRDGAHFVVGDISGAPGKSFKVCLVGDKRGLHGDFANGEKATRDLIGLWMSVRGLKFAAAMQEIAAFTGVAHVNGNGNGQRPIPEKPAPIFDWGKCVRALTEDHIAHLAQWRGYSIEFCRQLVADEMIGLYASRIAFPVKDQAENILGAHYYVKEVDKWRYTKGTKVRPLIIGDIYNADEVHIKESQWDALAVMDRCQMYKRPGIAFLITRGAGNAELLRDRLPGSARVYVWPQNDEPDEKGKIPSEIWLEKVIATANRRVFVVRTPEQFEDANGLDAGSGERGRNLGRNIGSGSARKYARNQKRTESKRATTRGYIGRRRRFASAIDLAKQ